MPLARTASAALRLLLLAALLAGLLTGVGQHPGDRSTAVPAPAPSAAGPDLVPVAARTSKVRLRTAVRRLRLASETPRGYARSKFRLWVDADGDCRDTRDEVLTAESLVKVQGCDVTAGRWFSYYDRRTWTRSSDVDIDHLVPLKEAWDSGARGWNAGTRTRYANDLGDRRALVAVTDNVNQSKSDADPAAWLPAFGRCRYVREWTAVKLRWGLRVDRAEKRQLRLTAGRCRNVWVTVKKARVVRGGATSGSSSSGGADLRSYRPVSTYHCPRRAPIKGNEPSMIYHPPSSPWYERTTPEQCFASEAGARHAGFRRAQY